MGSSREYNEDDVNNVEFNDGTISLDCTEEVYDEIIHTIATLKDLATKSVYLIIASDWHMMKNYDRILCISDEKSIRKNAKRILLNMGCSLMAANWQSAILEEEKEINNVYKSVDTDEFDFNFESRVDNFTLRIEEV